MSSLLNFYADHQCIKTNHDINALPGGAGIPKDHCNHAYLSGNPTGWNFDLGIETIGNRPVWKPYHVGHFSSNTPTNKVDSGKYNCRTPCWNKDCR